MSEREDQIRSMIAEGVERRHIIVQLAKKFGIAERSVADQFRKLAHGIAMELSQSKEEIAMVILERKYMLYKKCVSEKKYKTADDILNGIAKLAGLFEVKGNVTREVPRINLFEEDYSAPLKVAGDESETNS